MTDSIFSDQIRKTKPSFVREILKYAQQDEMISFAGGLPNPIAIPTDALAESSARVIKDYGYRVFQYSNSEGYIELRKQICERYDKRFHLKFDPEDVLITTGSQQGNDLIGKALLNKGDQVLLEKPAYLGAIQIFSLFQPEFLTVDIDHDGPQLDELEEILKANHIKLMYTVPNFQNPTGITYGLEKRKKMCELLDRYHVVLIEDDPYGELRFKGENLPYIGAGKLDRSILFGTFSKTVSPGLRVGYLITKDHELMRNLLTAKQATDLHTDVLAQHIISDYFIHNDYETHISKIKQLYLEQSHAMVESMRKYFPADIHFTDPDGGMFLWVSLKENQSSLDLFQRCIKKNVAFVPGDPFYMNITNASTLRLNYTNSNVQEIQEGIKRIAECLE